MMDSEWITNQLSMVKSLIVRACVKVVHSGDWSTFVWNNNRLRLQLPFWFRQSTLPFSKHRFFFGPCDI